MSTYDPSQQNESESPPSDKDSTNDGLNKSGLGWAYALLSALIVIPVSMQWVPSEIALWKQADARNHWEAKEQEKALALSAQALDWDSNNPALLTERADWLAELGRYNDAIGIYEAMLSELTASTAMESPGKATTETAFSIQLRMQLCNHLNSRAIKNEQPSEETWLQWQIINDWYLKGDRIRQLPLLQEANLYNNRAYQLAISRTHLEEALESANQSLESIGGEVYCLYRESLYHVQLGYQDYRQKHYRKAMENLNKAVDNLSRHHALLQRTPQTITWKAFEKKELAKRIADYEMLFGKVLLLRHECKKQINREADGPAVYPNSDEQTDQQQAMQLGVDSSFFNPEEAHFGSLMMSFNVHAFIPMALDTRGYIYYLQGYNHLALMDLQVAAEASEYELQQFNEALKHEQHRIADMDLVERQRKERKKNVAVILYHRSLAYDATHQVAKAKRDRERIQELGFSPSEMLH